MSDDLTPIRYHQPIQKYVDGLPSGNQYVFTVRNGISLVFVQPEDVQPLLDKRGGCCNKKKRLFGLASDDIVRVWQKGGRP
jgi:hypothetical protein